ncbi:MAG: D-glycerate dehydrogenase [Dehalococcoidia bacterium]|nr:D-glycerate dehydrogenase [Dehalococcoidia bacterium]
MEASLPIACVTVGPPPEVLARLEAVCQVREVAADAPARVLQEALAGAEGLLCSALLPVNEFLMARAPRLRVVSNFGVGFNNVDLPEATRRGIAVCNTPGVLSDAVADLTLALILAASRRVVENAAYVSSRGWSGGRPAPALGFDVGGKTLGIIGLGRIGRAVAQRARAFGMEVIYHDTFETPPEGSDYCRYKTLDELLREADIVSLHVNLTPATHHLLGTRELGLMKRTAWVVNTSRGPVIDQAALVRALRAGVIAGAALDVLETEPPMAKEPILSLPNVVLLPHVGSATVETRAAMLDLAVKNLLAVLAGEEPPACVNREALPRALKRR